MMPLRVLLTLLHRWVGLTIAAFLFVAGLTGAVIAWDDEIDALLNPGLTRVTSRGAARSPFEIAKEIEARDARVRVTYVPLSTEPGQAWNFGVDPAVDPATNRSYEPGYNEVFVDPVTGKETGRREWGAAWPVTRENFMSFLYVLHYSLHIPEVWGAGKAGVWLMGAIAILWTLDCFVGFYLTLPVRRARGRVGAAGAVAVARGFWTRWAPAWKIKTSGSAYRINFDVHRAFGLWAWGLLFLLAFTGFSMNLYSEVFYPLVSKVSKVTPSPFDTRAESPEHPIPPSIGFADVVDRAAAEARRRNWVEPPGGVYYAGDYGIYSVRFFPPGQEHGAAGLGPKMLYLDGADGRLLGDFQPWEGTAADVFIGLQFPLHSGRILGLPGRILVSLLGLVVAALSVTGVVIWSRKRAARLFQDERRAPSAPPREPVAAE